MITKKNILINIAIVLFLILLGVASRVMPHPWNFTPLSAIALVISAYFGFRYSILAVIGMMILSDLVIGSYHPEIMIAVYSSFIFAAILGTTIKRKNIVRRSRGTLTPKGQGGPLHFLSWKGWRDIGTIFSASLGASLVFFFITNWAVWQFGTMYAPTLSGLWQSYLMALPFFKNSLAGDLIYTGAFFAVFEACLYLKVKISQARLPLSV